MDQEVAQTNGGMGEVEPQNGDILGDLLAIEGPPGVSGTEILSEEGALALAPVGEQENAVKVLLLSCSHIFYMLSLLFF